MNPYETPVAVEPRHSLRMANRSHALALLIAGSFWLMPPLATIVSYNRNPLLSIDASWIVGTAFLVLICFSFLFGFSSGKSFEEMRQLERLREYLENDGK